MPRTTMAQLDVLLRAICLDEFVAGRGLTRWAKVAALSNAHPGFSVYDPELIPWISPNPHPVPS